MKKFFNKCKQELPLCVSGFVLALVLLLWSFPKAFYLIGDKDSISQFRSDLKDVASLFYYVATFWLVLVTRKMSQINLNALKASNRPELQCELFISNHKPSKEDFPEVNNLEIKNTTDSHYSDDFPGASIFLIVKNSNRGGKAINLQVTANFIAMSPDSSNVPRSFEIASLPEGDCVVTYIHRFEAPAPITSTLNLIDCSLIYTTPFNEASKEQPMKINYGKQNPILAKGNLAGSLTLGDGIGTEE